MSAQHLYDVKPSDADVNLIYNCPNCAASNYVTPKEARLIQKIVCNNCEAFLELKPIEKINLHIDYANTSFLPVKNAVGGLLKEKIYRPGKQVAAPPANGLSDVLDSLVNLGFKRKEAAARIEKAVFILGNSEAGPEMVLEKALTL